MTSKISPGSIATILNELQAGVPTSQQFPKLFSEFRPLIYSMAGSFSFNWKQDFIQEGMVGLFKAAESFSNSTVSPDKFIAYATTTIRGKMIDFKRRVLSKGTKEMIEYSIDGGEQKFMQPLFGELSTVKFDGEEEDDPFNNVASTSDAATATIQGIDFKYNFSTEGLTRNGFSEKEIAAFNLHIMEGYRVSEVAEKIGVSISQSSKIISKVRSKVLLILSVTQNSNLN